MNSVRAPEKVGEQFDARVSADPTSPSAERRSAVCLNCGTALAGPFCSACGQRDIPPYPDVRELVIDAFWELSGWDGRFLATVRKLFTAPGALTRDFLEGRRARYISPLRLYLMASLVYFVAAAAAPQRDVSGLIDAGGVQIGLGAPGRIAANAQAAGKGSAPASPAERDSMLASVAKAPKLLQPMLRKAVVDPGGFKRSMSEAMPRTLFALLPVFAAIVALFYWRRKYPEHLYFAVHLHAFIFLVLTLSVLARFAHSTSVSGVVGMLVTISIPIYATLAFRRTYGGGIGATIAKEIGIGFIYAVAGLVAILATVYWAALFG